MEHRKSKLVCASGASACILKYYARALCLRFAHFGPKKRLAQKKIGPKKKIREKSFPRES